MKGLTLNPKQQEAASHLDGPMAVLSVAGSGKTMVLTERIIQLIENHNVDASSILAITFAKKAVLEIIGRLETKLNGNSGRVHVSTFHSLGYRILKKTGYPTTGFRLVYDEEQLRLFIEAVSKAKVHEEPLDLLKRVSLAKNDLVTPQALKDAKRTAEKSLAKVLMEYEMLKRRRRVVDFDDLLCLPYRLLSQDDGLLHYYQDRFRYVLVDEFQDSSRVMVELVKLLSGNHQNIWVAGDDDQSIHGFRGARADTFIEFEKHCNGSLRTVAMNQNYRSSGNIIALANRLISRNKSRVEKEMETDRDIGEEVQIVELMDETKEAEFISEGILDLKKRKFKLSDIAILARIYRLMPLIEVALIKRKMPYTSRDGFFFSRKEIALSMLVIRQLLEGTEQEKIDQELLSHIITDLYPKQGELSFRDALYIAGSYVMMGRGGFSHDEDQQTLKRAYLEAFEHLAADFETLPDFQKFVSSAQTMQRKSKDNAVNLMTIHQAKGLEFRAVFIPGLNEGILPHINSVEELVHLEEERRLMYVAMTRAMDRLIITHRRRQQGQEITAPSRFLKELA